MVIIGKWQKLGTRAQLEEVGPWRECPRRIYLVCDLFFLAATWRTASLCHFLFSIMSVLPPAKGGWSQLMLPKPFKWLNKMSCLHAVSVQCFVAVIKS